MRRSFATIFFCLSFVFVGIAQYDPPTTLKDRVARYRTTSGFQPTDTTYINLLEELGRTLRYYDSDSTFLLAKEVLEFSKKARFKTGVSRAHLLLGDYYSDTGNPEKAIAYYEEAYHTAEVLGDNYLMLRCLNNISAEYEYRGDYARAMEGYLKGLDLAKSSGEQLMLSILYENLANLYASQKDYEQALELYKKVKKINEHLKDSRAEAETSSNLASLYADMGQLDYAMFYVNRSIATFEQQKVIDWLAYAYEIKGKVYLKEKKFRWALYWYRQSELLHAKISDDRGKIDLLNGMAEAYLGQNEDDISRSYALEAFEISKRISFLEGMKNCAHTLYQVHKNKLDYPQALQYHELYQGLYDTLSRNENRKSLTILQTTNKFEKQRQALIDQNNKALAQQQRIVILALVSLLIISVIAFIFYRGKKIQNKLVVELNRKTTILEAHEAELKENNDTKTKLFSIIGHDLRGPIGALQELLKLFGNGDMTKKEMLDFIPKLKEDIGHISFTLNNLLSWGHTQLKGSVVNPSVVNLESLVTENINLLAEIAESKSIRVINEIKEPVHIWSDSNQIDVVVRNLISNALKFTPENGMITIKALERTNHWEIAIRDNGIGMEPETVSRLFDDHSNISTYGTNNEKGTGLGLSLCKEMLEKNNGKIWVESSLRKGSCFYFTLPKAGEKFSKAS